MTKMNPFNSNEPRDQDILAESGREIPSAASEGAEAPAHERVDPNNPSQEENNNSWKHGASTPGFRAWFRPVIALIMIAAASLGGLAAFRASVMEQQTVMLKLRLSSGRMLELARWTEFAHQLATRADLEQPYAAHQRRADWLLEQADQLRAKDEQRAGQMDMEAQRERALQRIYLGLVGGLKNFVDNKSVGDSIRDHVIAELEQFGFGKGADGDDLLFNSAAKAKRTRAAVAGHDEQAGDEPDRLGHFWDDAYRHIAESHEKVLMLTIGVAIFVLALFAFTLADLSAKRFALAVGLLCTGSVIVLCGTVFLLLCDDWSWLSWAVGSIYVLFLCLGTLALKTGLMNTPPPKEGEDMKGIEPRGYHGHEIALAKDSDGLSGWLVFLVAVTVLSSALVAYAYSLVSVAASHHAQTALDYQVGLVESSALSGAKITGGVMTTTAEWLANRTGCAFDQQRGTAGSDSQGCVQLEKRPKNFGYYAKDYVVDTGYFGPFRMYRGLFASLEPSPAYLYAASDAFQEMSAAAIGRGSSYLAVLTLFAIALYLFGQALAVGRSRLQVLFLVAGIGLLAGSDAWACAIYLGSDVVVPPSDAPANCAIPHEAEKSAMFAAQKYKEAMRHYALASTAVNAIEAKDEYRGAAVNLECAAAARPLFAMAHRYLALAYGRMDSQQWREASYESLVSRRYLLKIIANQEHAWQALTASGLPGVGIGKPGFDYFLMALAAKTPGESAHALELSRRFLEEDASRRAQPGAIFNWGLVNLADGRTEDAANAYKSGIEMLTKKRDWSLVVSAITDLNLLTEYCPNLPAPRDCESLAPVVRRIKSSLLTERWLDEVSDSEQPGILSDLKLDVRPQAVEWRARITTSASQPAIREPQTEPGLDQPQSADRGTLTVLWYTRPVQGERDQDENWNVWRVQEGISRQIRLADLASGEDGTVGDSVDILAKTDMCLLPGEYRAEFFLDGRSLDVPAQEPIRIGSFEAYRSRELDVAFCYPAPKDKAAEFPDEANFRMVSGPSFMAGIWKFYAPRGRESYTKRAALFHALAGADNAARTDALMELAGKFAGCGPNAAAEGLPHREIVHADGSVRVLVISKYKSVQEACFMLDSFQRYWQ
jgi:hypothetical protein